MIPMIHKAGIRIFRLRMLLRPQSVCSIPVHQAAMFYAMLCDAYGRSADCEPVMPDGVLLDAPDQAIRSLAASQPLALGLTILSGSTGAGGMLAQSLVDGLRELGRKPAKRQALGRFSVDQLQDMVAGHTVHSFGSIQPIADSWFASEMEALGKLAQLTLRFYSPLRTVRPVAARRDGHTWFDDGYFSPQPFLNRLRRRLDQLGIVALEDNAGDSRPGNGHNDCHKKDKILASGGHGCSAARCERNQLVWLNVGYGGRKSKTLGGAVGAVSIDNLARQEIETLIWGQYVRVGENTRFGFGNYRIMESPVDPMLTARATCFVDRAFHGPQIDRMAEEAGLGSGIISQTVQQIGTGSYQPAPPVRIEIPKPAGGTRQLAIPTPLDRTLQRLLLDTISPGVDGFLESSAVAFRKGLGRAQAARQLRRAFRSGYRWALKADFDSFFDRVDHDLLRHRLNAYLNDPSTVALVMRWVASGAPETDRGLPTGAPISPLLANLFLDQFDEQIKSQKGLLIRYADDLMILCRTEEDAHRYCDLARQQAESLKLQLNNDKTRFVDLGRKFKFLGYQFECHDSWQVDRGNVPQLIEDIGWRAAKPAQPKSMPTVSLPGETDWDDGADHTTVIAGDAVTGISCHADRLALEGPDVPVTRIPLQQIEHLIVMGNAKIQWQAQQKLARHAVPVWICDSTGGIQMEILPERSVEDAAAIAAQFRQVDDEAWSLAIARQLVAAKLVNYAILAMRYHRHPRRLVSQLEHHAIAALRTERIDSLLGIEGSGAACWYGQFDRLLGHGFEFRGRVAPDAADPVNALLNLGFTILYRLLRVVIRASGLVDSVGTLHQVRGGHAALASDLQEVFRPLVDRAVIEATHRLRPNDFHADPDGPYALKIGHWSMKKYFEIVHRLLALPVAGHRQSTPVTWRRQMHRMVRRYKINVLDGDVRFLPFVHPGKLTERVFS